MPAPAKTAHRRRSSASDTKAGTAAELHRRVLQSLRRVLRQVEMSSRVLEADYGVTAPQLICLIEIVAAGSTTQIELSKRVHLSASTLVGVLDRLQAKKLVARERDDVDRRRINITPTGVGKHLVEKAPPPLQDTLLKGLGALSKKELVTMAASLERLVDLLEAHEIAEEPMLAPGPIPKLDV